MTKKTSLYKSVVLLLPGVLGMPVMAHAQKIQTTAASLPVWIQAIGTVAAILVAVLVMSWQYRSTKRRDESREKQRRAREQEREFAETRSLLCSARHELAFFYMNCKEGAGEVLKQISEGGYLEHIVPVEHERYYIYPICASNIGKVKDAKLGRQILFAYAMQIKFIETVKWNNNLLQWFRDAQKKQVACRDEDASKVQRELEESLMKHVLKMTAAFEEMETATQTVMAYINEDGTISPRNRHKLHSQYYFLNSPQSVRYK